MTLRKHQRDTDDIFTTRDESRPERGLLGMINGTWLIQKWDESDYEVTVWDKKGMESFVGTTPTLALLKALAAQEGLEEVVK